MTLVGTTVGHIRVVEALGKGGMGEVYAGYDEKLKRKVALKAIRDERRLDAEAKARFLREARILSQLDHPAICRIHELVEGEEVDFLVLELIPGKSLKRVMEEDELDDAFKLHVAERVTEALMAAHERGVAHRDLKPENVMLTPEGGVKVLDFGLALSLHSRAYGATPDAELMAALDGEGAAGRVPEGAEPSDETALTVAPRAAPPAAEPPQPLDPTVVWSGAQPTVGPGLETTRSGASPPDPGSEHGSTPSDFVETQRGIVMGTVAYMSPEQARGERVTVAGDLYSLGLLMQELFTGRTPYQEDLALLEMLRSAASATTRPVTGVDPDLGELIERLKSLDPASRPTAVETAERLRWIRGKPGRKLLRRLAAALVVVLLLGGLKYTFDLRRERAEAQVARREAEDVLEFVVGLFSVAEPETARGREITARELLDAGAADVAGALRDQPRSQSRLMLTMGRIYRQLGDYDRARSLLEEGLAIRPEVGEADLGVAAALDQLAGLYTDQGDYARAEPLFQRALEIREQELGADHLHVAASLNNLAFHHLERGAPADAEPLLLRALEIQRRAGGGEHQGVANSLINLGELYRDRGELDRGLPFLERALELQEKLLPKGHPDLAYSLNTLAMIHHARGETPLAEPLFRRALAVQEKVLGAGHPNVAVSLNNLAEVHRSVGEYGQAAPLYARALEIQEQTLGLVHPGVAITLSNLGDLHAARGEAALAGPLYARALEIQTAALGADHPSVAVTLNHRADLHLAGVVDPLRAEALYDRALEIQERAFGRDHPSVAITLADLAGLHARQDRHTESERLYLRAQASARRILSGDPDSRTARRLLAQVRLGLGGLYQATGATGRAAESFAEALALIEPLTAGSDAVASLHVHALALLRLGRVEEARPLVEKLQTTGWSHPDLVITGDAGGTGRR